MARESVAVSDRRKSLLKFNYFIGLAALIALGITAYRALPPSHVTIATGPVGGSYYEDAEKYKQILKKEGITLDLEPVPSSLDIVNHVEAHTDGVELGFVAGHLDATDYPNTFSLGAIEQQPLFIFVQSKLGAMGTPDRLRGHRLVMPPERSVTSQAALALLAQYDVTPANTSITFLPISKAVAALRGGGFDAGFFMLDPQDEFITTLAADSNLTLAELRDTLTLSRLDPSLHPVVLPHGVFNLEADNPPQDVHMLAATINVVARKDAPQAIVYRLLQAMEDSHRGSSLINDAGTFPNLVDIALPAHPLALDYQKNGMPWAYQNLPRWLAPLANSYLIIGLVFVVLVELWSSILYFMELIDFLFVHFWLRVLLRIEHRARRGHALRPADIKLVDIAESALLKTDRRRRSEELIGRIRAARGPSAGHRPMTHLAPIISWLIMPLVGARPHGLAGWAAWHGRLMVLSWSILIPSGVLIARYGKITAKQDWPAVLDNRLWWDWHRRLQYAGLGLAFMALVICVIHARLITRLDVIHACMGWSVMALGVSQAASAMFRGTKGGPTGERAPVGDWRGDHYDMTTRRVIFEYVHKIGGSIAVLLAACTVILGLFVADAPRWMLIVILGWWAVLAAAATTLQRRGRCIDTYQAIWGPDPIHPGNRPPTHRHRRAPLEAAKRVSAPGELEEIADSVIDPFRRRPGRIGRDDRGR